MGVKGVWRDAVEITLRPSGFGNRGPPEAEEPTPIPLRTPTLRGVEAFENTFL